MLRRSDRSRRAFMEEGVPSMVAREEGGRRRAVAAWRALVENGRELCKIESESAAEKAACRIDFECVSIIS